VLFILATNPRALVDSTVGLSTIIIPIQLIQRELICLESEIKRLDSVKLILSHNDKRLSAPLTAWLLATKPKKSRIWRELTCTRNLPSPSSFHARTRPGAAASPSRRPPLGVQ
jgi:hypothetical protein